MQMHLSPDTTTMAVDDAFDTGNAHCLRTTFGGLADIRKRRNFHAASDFGSGSPIVKTRARAASELLMPRSCSIFSTSVTGMLPEEAGIWCVL